MPSNLIPKINLAKRKAKAAEAAAGVPTSAVAATASKPGNTPALGGGAGGPQKEDKTSGGFSLNPFIPQTAKKEAAMPQKITLDDKGRMLDESGREIEVDKKIS
mmetsp:Transcript_32164/g.49190  ORF Transcript_32164/g.49190 Transcript_32164/m.49190 type:complete len:104 (-) Transcript_32164:1391-1702(-)